MLNHPNTINRLYERLSRYEPSLLRVPYDPLREYCRTFVNLRRRKYGADGLDDRLHEILQPYSRFMYDALSAPIPFSSAFYNYLPEDELVGRVRSELGKSYPELCKTYEKLLAELKALRDTDDNPLLEKIISLEPKDEFPLVVKRPRYVEVAHQAAISRGLKAKVTTAGSISLRRAGVFGAAVGFSAGSFDFFPESLRRVPMAKKIAFVEFDWIKKPRSLHPLFMKPLAYTPLPDIAGAEAVYIPDASEDEFTSPVTDGIAGLRKFALRDLEENHPGAESERVPARLAIFENNWLAFLSADDSTRQSVVQLRDNGDIQIVRKRIVDLETDDALILRLGGGGDYVEEVADKLLGLNAEPFRKMQKLWKRQLGERVDQFETLELASKAIRAAGCTVAEPQNIRNWLAPRSIGLASRSDWSALCKFLDINDETDSIHWDAIRMLRKTHLRAGNEIRNELLDLLTSIGISELNKVGSQIVQIPKHEEVSVILLSLIQMDSEVVEVPVNRLERPFERDH